jgi:CO dehydrogenase/acetyl-CoA synthase alpha subunit
MGLLKDSLKTTVGGLAIGIGAAVLAPIVVPILASIAKPLTKAVIKEGLILYDKGKESVAEAKETIEDLMAEAKAEIVSDPDPAAETGSGAVAVAAAASAAKARPGIKIAPIKQPPKKKKAIMA